MLDKEEIEKQLCDEVDMFVLKIQKYNIHINEYEKDFLYDLDLYASLVKRKIESLISSIEFNKDELEGEIGDMKEQINKLESEINDKNDEIDNKNDKIITLEQKIDDKNDKISMLEQNIDDLNKNANT